MNSTMLELVQQATGEMGLSVPTFVAGNTAQDTVQQLALLNRVGKDILRQHEWSPLIQQYIFDVEVITLTGDTLENVAEIQNASTILDVDSTYQVVGNGINQATYVSGTPFGSTIELSQVATATAVGQTFTLTKSRYTMPSDYDRQINRTHWDKSKHWEMLGPETAQQWEWLISGYISTGPRVRYRIFGGYFQIWPALGNFEVLGFEYLSKNWVRAADGTPKSSFTVDTDTCIYPDNLMVQGLMHRYFMVKGFGDIYQAGYEAELSNAKATEAGAQTLAMNPQPASVLIGWNNIPDSFPIGS